MAGAQLHGVQANCTLVRAATALEGDPNATDGDVTPYADYVAKSLESKTPGIRIAAARTLARAGSHAVPQAAAMGEKLSARNANSLRKAEANLGNMGEAGARVLGQKFTDDDLSVRTNAMVTLSTMGTIGASQLASHLAHDDADIRNAASKALVQQGEIGAHVLGKTLRSPDPLLRANAARSLTSICAEGARLAPVVHQYIPDFLTLLDDDRRDGDVRTAGKDALVRMGCVGAVALATRLADDHATIRQTVSTALLSMGDVGVQVVTQCLCDRAPEIRRQALALLTKNGATGAAALAGCLNDTTNAGVRRRGAEGLGLVGAELAAPHVLALAACLEDGDHWVQIAAARSLGQLGVSTGSRAAAGELLAPFATGLSVKLRAQQALVRHSAAKSLGRAGAAVARCHADNLVTQLADEDHIVRSRAACSLAEMGEVGESATSTWLHTCDEFPRGSRGALCTSNLRPLLGRAALVNDRIR